MLDLHLTSVYDIFMNLDEIRKVLPEADEYRLLRNYRLGENVSLLSKAISINFFENIYRHPTFTKYDFISHLNTLEKRIILNLGSSAEPLSIKTLAMHIGAKQKSMHYPLKCLQAKNMVQLHDGEYDKRETLVSLTPEARKMNNDYDAASIIAEYDVFSGISDEDIDELNNCLKQARTLLEKHFPIPDEE